MVVLAYAVSSKRAVNWQTPDKSEHLYRHFTSGKLLRARTSAYHEQRDDVSRQLSIMRNGPNEGRNANRKEERLIA